MGIQQAYPYMINDLICFLIFCAKDQLLRRRKIRLGGQYHFILLM
jgi:hypothetical protein